jgi:hypothetical protein
MTLSGDIWVLNKIAELTHRCGVSPAIANVELKLNFPENGDYYYTLSMVDGCEETSEDVAGVAKVRSLLGLDEEMSREIPRLSEVERIVDHALSLVPRPRLR